MLDPVARWFYEAVFERDFLRKRGPAFQDWFSDLMEKRYPGDFQRIRPWGAIGDQKNDGYLKSKRTVYQVYAPNEMTAGDAVKKTGEDFAGYITHWRDYFDIWCFVHNARDGLSVIVDKHLQGLDVAHAPIRVERMGYQELNNLVFELPAHHLTVLFGPPLSAAAFQRVRFGDLGEVFRRVITADPQDAPAIEPPPRNKVRINKLSPNVEHLLNLGQQRAHIVKRFLRESADPTAGDRIASALSAQYGQLKNTGIPPDMIFYELQSFVGGAQRGPPEHEAAVLTVLSYFFSTCDIFERGEVSA